MNKLEFYWKTQIEFLFNNCCDDELCDIKELWAQHFRNAIYDYKSSGFYIGHISHQALLTNAKTKDHIIGRTNAGYNIFNKRHALGTRYTFDEFCEDMKFYSRTSIVTPEENMILEKHNQNYDKADVIMYSDPFFNGKQRMTSILKYDNKFYKKYDDIIEENNLAKSFKLKTYREKHNYICVKLTKDDITEEIIDEMLSSGFITKIKM